MGDRPISLSPRAEGTREARPISLPVRFSLPEIKQHFTDGMNDLKKQYEVADSLSDEYAEARKTIWRSQIVFAEGLLDFYIHEMSKYCVLKMFSGAWDKSERYKNFRVPMSMVEEAISSERDEWLLKLLTERFSREVFLSLESMRDQLNLIGIEFKSVMVKAFPRDSEQLSIDEGSGAVQDLYKRRNEIAHQNDRSHTSAQQTDITKEFVEDYIGKVESIVNAIHEIAEQKDGVPA